MDPLSGIDTYHLTFIMKRIFPLKMICSQISTSSAFYRNEEMYFHFLGSVANNTNVMLTDISCSQKMNQTRPTTYHGRHYDRLPRIVVFKQDLIAVHANEYLEGSPLNKCVLVDCHETPPGYCRLRLPFPSTVDERNGRRVGSNIYQNAFIIPDDLRSKMSKVATGEIQYIGVCCKTFPFSRRWPEGKAGREFPSRRLIDSFIKQGCSLIPKSHKYSVSPDIEWQFNFSMAEYIIFQNLTYAQKHGFCVLKVLTENMINDVPYKLKHLKNVYLMALEDIPSSAWETSFSGCVLFVLDKLLECYKKKHIPIFFYTRTKSPCLFS